MAVGLADTDKIFYAAASGVNMPIVYLGSKTGRDGIHGASMASAEFDDDSAEKRPTVQVGDPFAEKLLLEACLEIMEADCVIAIQDMGAAGLTCSAVEMGAKGDLGVDLNLDAVPTRETGMSAYEMMLSESQERMLMVLKPEKEKEAEAIFKKWGLDFAVVGYTTPSKRFVVKHGGDVMADLPIKELGDEAPLYDRPHVASALLPMVRAQDVKPPIGIMPALEKLIAHAGAVFAALGLGAIRPRHSRQYRAASRRRCRCGARRGRPEGAGAHRRRDAALLRGRSVSGRHAGGRRSLAQHHGRRRTAAGDHRQSQFRQSGTARNHGPVRRLPEGHFGSLPHARLPGRVRQRLALQRDQRPRHSADALDRRRRPARRFHQIGDAGVQGRWRGDPADRRHPGLARPVGLSARHLRPRRGRAAAGRSRRRKAQRRRGARHDPRGHRDGGA